jgi:transglutaminase-like putative cysteine protease
MTFAAVLRRELPLEAKRLLWTAAIVVGTSLPHWGTLPTWIPVLLCVAVSWRFAVNLYGWPMVPRALRLVFALVTFLAVLFQYRTLNGVEAGSALLVVMVALKFLESKTQRDELVLVMISYFLMFASVLTERSPVTAAYIVLLVWLTTVALLQIGRRGELLANRRTAAASTRLLLQALPVMVVLFVFFPRLPGPLWAIPGSTSSGATGLNDTMSPGDITNLGLSDEIAFRVEFDDRPPRASALYWRGPSLTQFNGRTWSPPLGSRRGERVADSTEFRGEPTTYRVTLEPNGRNWAFALDMPATWSGDNSLRMGSDYQLGTFFGGGPRTRRLDYRVTSYVDYSAREPLTPREIDGFRALPEGSSPRARELAASWLVGQPTQAEIITRAMDWLRSQPFEYTLTPPALGAQPVDEFLFETREGFCEHYASALTVLLRAAGLPARVVMGYQGGELNAIGGYYIVRQSDAHAWTEVWLEDEGWVRVDGVAAVAPERVALGSFAGQAETSIVGAALRARWLRQATLLWDAVNTRWQAWVIGYGPEVQRALLEWLGFDGLRRTQRQAVLLTLGVAATIGLLLGLSVYLRWRQRRRAPVDRAARSFAEFVRHLARLAVPPRAPGEGPRAYAERAARALPGEETRIRSVTALYLAARYEPDTDGAALAELEAEVAALRAARA